MRRKEFWPLHRADSLINRFMTQLSHDSDGLILQGGCRLVAAFVSSPQKVHFVREGSHVAWLHGDGDMLVGAQDRRGAG